MITRISLDLISYQNDGKCYVVSADKGRQAVSEYAICCIDMRGEKILISAESSVWHSIPASQWLTDHSFAAARAVDQEPAPARIAAGSQRPFDGSRTSPRRHARILEEAQAQVAPRASLAVLNRGLP
jgi:hypothetical protein